MRQGRKNNSVDGFIPRKSNLKKGSLHTKPQNRLERRRESLVEPKVQELHDRQTNIGYEKLNQDKKVSKSEIDSFLQSVDGDEFDKKGRHKKDPKRRARIKKVIKRIIILIIVLALVVGGYLAFKTFVAGNKIFNGNLFDILQKQKLKQDEDGRTNIVVFGTSEDDEGGNHPGANLTDSIMLVSINQEKKTGAMVSIPRDFWVKYAEACEAGYEGKINVVYQCASDDGKDEKAGANALMEKVGQIFGLDVQYYVHVNNTVVRDAVNAVGGVKVKIESEDPRGIYDPNFDWQCNYKCKLVYYKNGEIADLDGQHALALARARNAQGGYGLPNSNYDREKNQQKIIRSLQKKALSTGTLLNFGKVTSLIDAFGDNLRTNFETKELRTLVDLSQSIKGDKLQSISMGRESNPIVKNSEFDGQSVVIPIDGTYDYSGIKKFIKLELTNNPVAKEGASVDIYNASGVDGQASDEAEKLEKAGMNIAKIGNLPVGKYQGVTIYKIGEGNKATEEKLKKMYDTEITEGSPPVLSSYQLDFVIILGK